MSQTPDLTKQEVPGAVEEALRVDTTHITVTKEGNDNYTLIGSLKMSAASDLTKQEIPGAVEEALRIDATYITVTKKSSNNYTVNWE